MGTSRYLINGKFLEQTITGVQRYANEMLLQLDKLCCRSGIELSLGYSQSAKIIPELYNIKTLLIGKHSGVVWEQFDLPFYAIKEKYTVINFCNASSLVKPDIVFIHDVQLITIPNNFSLLYRVWGRLLLFNSAKRAKFICTVSNFSKDEIINKLNINCEIFIIHSAWQHIKRIASDNSIYKRYPEIKKKDFFFAMSSLSPNKNFEWIVENAKNNPDQWYVVAGNINNKLFAKSKLEEVNNCLFVGRITDGEAKQLMTDCKAFLYPSFYEGFGLPPLEAISCGASCIVSDIDVLHEVYDDTVGYINPYDSNCKISNELIKDGENILQKYSWEESAYAFLALLNKENVR